jgi:hypothetical protein
VDDFHRNNSIGAIKYFNLFKWTDDDAPESSMITCREVHKKQRMSIVDLVKSATTLFCLS